MRISPVQQGDGNDLFSLSLSLELVFLTITHLSLVADVVVELFAFFSFPLRLVEEIDAKSDNDDATSDGFDTSLSFHISKR